MTPPQQSTLVSENDCFVITVQEDKLKAYISCPDGRHCQSCTFAAYDCPHHHLTERVTLFNKATIPAVFEPATLTLLREDNEQSPSMKQAMTWLLTWISRDPLPLRGMLFYGPWGIGKSFSLAAMVRYLTLERGISCRFLVIDNFLTELKECYSQKKNDEHLLAPVIKTEVLIMDDIGSGRRTEWAKDVVQSIIARRYNACKRTFLTTNLAVLPSSSTPTSQLELWIGSHCFSRLREMCYWLSLDGQDRRSISCTHYNFTQ